MDQDNNLLIGECKKYIEEMKSERIEFKKTIYRTFVLLIGTVIILVAAQLIGYGSLLARVDYQEEQIRTIRKNYVSGDMFILFAQSYELQTEAIIAINEENKNAANEIAQNYRKLRQLILEQIQLDKKK